MIKRVGVFLGVLLVSRLFAGTITGRIYYTGARTGTIFVAVGSDPSDLSSGSYTTLFTPGPYTITGSFVDTVDYFAVGVMLTGFSPVSGDPAGMHPRPFRTVHGNASGIDITLAEEGSFGGRISYAGPISDVRINLYDAYPLLVGGEPIYENTLVPSSYNYRFDHIPSGPKRVVAFVDANRNNVLDSLEIFAFAETPMGGFVFVGGGFVMDSVNFNLATGIELERFPLRFEFGKPFPNPFNAEVSLPYKAERDAWVVVDVFDITGKMVERVYDGVISVGVGTIKWRPVSVSSGLYIIAITSPDASFRHSVLFVK